MKMGKVQDEVINSLLRLDYISCSYPSSASRTFVRNQVLRTVKYHVVLGLAILANSISIGFTVKGGSSMLNAVVVSEGVFCVVFSIDVFLRMYGLGMRAYIKSDWHRFDVVLLLFQYVQIVYVAINANSFSGSLVRVLSSLRMLRIFRLLRTVSVLPRFRGLWILISAMENALFALLWVGFMILLLIYGLAIAFTLLFARVETEDDPYLGVWRMADYWGGILPSMLTLFQIITLDNWSVHIMRPLLFAGEIHLWLRLTLLALVLSVVWFVTFGFLQVSVGVMCEAAGLWGKENHMKLVIYQTDQDTLIFKLLRKIFAATEMTSTALAETLRRRSVRRLLAIVDLTHKDVSTFFLFLTRDRLALVTTGNRTTTDVLAADEFATLLPHLRGQALGRDLISAELKVKTQVGRTLSFEQNAQRVNENLQTIQDDLDRLHKLFSAATSRSRHDN